MPYLLGLLGLACFGAAGYSFYHYNSQYFDLLVISGVILVASSEIIGAIYSIGEAHSRASGMSTKSAMSDFEIMRLIMIQLEKMNEQLEKMNHRLLNVQSAIERLEPPRMPRQHDDF